MKTLYQAISSEITYAQLKDLPAFFSITIKKGIFKQLKSAFKIYLCVGLCFSSLSHLQLYIATLHIIYHR